MEVRTSTASPRRASEKPLEQVMRERRATRHFASATLPESDLEAILAAAAEAPSGYNLQPWRLIVVREPENRRRLQEAAFDQEKVSEASAVIIFVGLKRETEATAKEIFEEGVRRGLGRSGNVDDNIRKALEFISGNVGWPVWLNRHTMIAFSFAMLMAEELGYDTAPMEGFDAGEVKRAFGIPDDAEVVALLAIGRAKLPDKPHPGRLPVTRVAFAERFGGRWPG